jgi:hypothetical protein
LDIVKYLTETELEKAQAKLVRYPSMARDLSSFLARRRPGDRTVRYNAANTSALAIIRGDGVLAVFISLIDL